MESIEAAQLTSRLAASAQQVKRTGAFTLACNADTAFPLFSPEGERLWIKGWNPRPIFPDAIAFQTDTVFHQGEGADQAVWTIVDVERKAHRAEYVRVVPASHVAHITVNIDELDQGGCRVSVSYAVTAFGADASSLLESFSESAYAEKMQNWRWWISEYLATTVAV